MGDGIVRLEAKRRFQEWHRGFDVLWHRSRNVRQRPKIEIVGTEIFWALLTRTRYLRLAYAWLDYSDHSVRR